MVTDLCHAHQRQRHIELRLCEVAVLILIGQRPDLPPRRPTPKLKRPSAHVHLAGYLEMTLCSFRASAGRHKPYVEAPIHHLAVPGVFSQASASQHPQNQLSPPQTN